MEEDVAPPDLANGERMAEGGSLGGDGSRVCPASNADLAENGIGILVSVHLHSNQKRSFQCIME